MAKRVKVVDKGYNAAILALRKLDGQTATIGLHAPENPRKEPGLTNVALGVVHEFGATINHPGGTDYMFNWSGAGRPAPMPSKSLSAHSCARPSIRT
jgi:hypothetical protein